jgi:hypothetical protein
MGLSKHPKKNNERDRIRKTVKKYSKQSDIDKYKKQRNRVNNLKKIAKEHFESITHFINILRVRK